MLVAPFAALVVVAALAGTSRASCGDWIVGHSIDAAVRTHGSAVGQGRSAAPIPASPLHDVPLCDGPACRSIPLPPAFPGEGIVTTVPSDPALVVPAMILPLHGRDRISAIPADAPGRSIPRAVPTPPPKVAGLL